MHCADRVRRGQAAAIGLLVLLALALPVGALVTLSRHDRDRQRKLEGSATAAARCTGALLFGVGEQVESIELDLEGVPGVWLRAGHDGRRVSLVIAGHPGQAPVIVVDYEGRDASALRPQIERVRSQRASVRGVYGPAPLERLCAATDVLGQLDAADRELIEELAR